MRQIPHLRHRSEAGASSVEYGILISLIAATLVAAIFAFGGVVSDLFSAPCQELVSNGAAPRSSSGPC